MGQRGRGMAVAWAWLRLVTGVFWLRLRRRTTGALVDATTQASNEADPQESQESDWDEEEFDPAACPPDSEEDPQGYEAWQAGWV